MCMWERCVCAGGSVQRSSALDAGKAYLHRLRRGPVVGVPRPVRGPPACRVGRGQEHKEAKIPLNSFISGPVSFRFMFPFFWVMELGRPLQAPFMHFFAAKAWQYNSENTPAQVRHLHAPLGHEWLTSRRTLMSLPPLVWDSWTKWNCRKFFFEESTPLLERFRCSVPQSVGPHQPQLDQRFR